MAAKYIIEYQTRGDHNRLERAHYDTDDPVASEEFVEDLLERSVPITAIRHMGKPMPKREFDRMVKTAAGMLASKHICASLGIKPEEVKYRFGFTA